MMAIRVGEFGGPEVLRLEEVPDLALGYGQVLITIHAVGVNPVETYIRAGTYAKLPPLPYTPGADAAGVIEAVGDGVTTRAVGERVYASATVTGAYAEKCVADAADVFPLPDAVSFPEAAGINTPYATAWRALLQRARARGGETVLVHGASGGVGIASVQIARANGLTVFGTAGTHAGRKLATEQGAHNVFDHTDAGYRDAIKAATPGGRGADVIVEMLANVNLAADLPLLAPGGRVVVVGSRGSVEINPRDLMSRDAAILGMSLPNASPGDKKEIHAALYAGLESGTLRPIINRELPLADAARAHELVMRAGAHGKIVLTP